MWAIKCQLLQHVQGIFSLAARFYRAPLSVHASELFVFERMFCGH